MQPAPCCLDTRQRYQKRWCKTFVCHEAWSPVLIGASLALAGTLLQTLTHNPMASPSLLGINSGAALAMALTSALSPTPIAGYSLSFIAACGGRRELAAGHDRRRRISSYP